MTFNECSRNLSPNSNFPIGRQSKYLQTRNIKWSLQSAYFKPLIRGHAPGFIRNFANSSTGLFDICQLSAFGIVNTPQFELSRDVSTIRIVHIPRVFSKYLVAFQVIIAFVQDQLMLSSND
jgi:hypothetical protein